MRGRWCALAVSMVTYRWCHRRHIPSRTPGQTGRHRARPDSGEQLHTREAIRMQEPRRTVDVLLHRLRLLLGRLRVLRRLRVLHRRHRGLALLQTAMLPAGLAVRCEVTGRGG